MDGAGRARLIKSALGLPTHTSNARCEDLHAIPPTGPSEVPRGAPIRSCMRVTFVLAGRIRGSGGGWWVVKCQKRKGALWEVLLWGASQ